MKQKLWILLAALLVLCGAGCGKDSGDIAVITMETGETIEIKLDAEQAPITVENFKKLVDEGFYDGLTFHRIEEGFVIQGGDPEGTGVGGPGHTIKGEFSQNGVENNLSHVRGVVSMARNNISFDSAGSQFFITLGDATFLDGGYAAFGTVDEDGMEQVDAIVARYLEDGKTPVMKTVELK